MYARLDLEEVLDHVFEGFLGRRLVFDPGHSDVRTYHLQNLQS